MQALVSVDTLDVVAKGTVLLNQVTFLFEGQASEPNRNPRLVKRAGLKPTCNLPHSWSGIWSNQQTLKELQYVISSITEGEQESSSTNRFNKANNERLIENAKQLYKTIDEYKFLNRGSCVNSNDERYFFYDE